MKELTLKVEGMTCNHCTMTVRRAVMSVEGVESAEVSLEEGIVRVRASDQVNVDEIKKAIESAGYKVSG
jgi:copper chaperone